MIAAIRNVLALLLVTIALSACGTSNPYDDADAQRERSRDAQDELRRDSSRY